MCIETQHSGWYTVRSKERSTPLLPVSSQSKTHQKTSTHAHHVLSQHVSLFVHVSVAWRLLMHKYQRPTSIYFLYIWQKNKVWDFAIKNHKNLKAKHVVVLTPISYNITFSPFLFFVTFLLFFSKTGHNKYSLVTIQSNLIRDNSGKNISSMF